VDADAVRQRRQRHTDRQISIWHTAEGAVSYLEGTLNPLDAHALDQRLNALAATVCVHDPRTPAQRRADALGALAAGATRLGCRCGRTQCGAGARPDATAVTIHVIAEQATLEGAGDHPGSRWCADGVITPELLAELKLTAHLVPLIHPGDAAPEPRYRPSTALTEFVKCRDLTCRFPGCDAPAAGCDVDHTIPYAQGGPTHAANLKCLCRWHHLIKTFWGWTDRQLADGTVIWTHPDGPTYITTPAELLFPSLCRPTLGGVPDADLAIGVALAALAHRINT
ncbi:HNH endonuclease signature motif containing protein, partial [Mycobacterium asiaticum]|uniref:HNH endonuclease signature motif containing protein n=1 Tax=Mycobacterium asiaticum TaxID=1790 RepID=UPI000AEFA0DD